ncbi:MAG: putative alpha/beta-hydrolase family hydrolase [Paraglaciecola sp.]|jgi:predicted alpha/beta-hydrolase family hydrolase
MELHNKIIASVCMVLIVASFEVQSDPTEINTQALTLMASNKREVAATVYSPAGGCNACTLLFFSHGANIPPENYAALINTWIPAGYVVASPLHVDAETHPNRDDYSAIEWATTRVEDYELLTDALIRQGIKIKGVTFSGAIIATGHSFGGLVAQIANGATMHPAAGVTLSENALRPIGAIAISPPGSIENYITKEGWSHMRKPVLVVTGTADSDPIFMPDWRLHKASYEAAPQGSAYLLVFDNIDHYFNGAFGRPTDKGFVSHPETHVLNARVLAFITAIEVNKLPSAASWLQAEMQGMTASSR